MMEHHWYDGWWCLLLFRCHELMVKIGLTLVDPSAWTSYYLACLHQNIWITDGEEHFKTAHLTFRRLDLQNCRWWMVLDHSPRASSQLWLSLVRECMQVRGASTTGADLIILDQLFSATVAIYAHPRTPPCQHCRWHRSWVGQHSRASRNPYPRTLPISTCVASLLVGVPSDRSLPSSQRSPSVSGSPVSSPPWLSVCYAFDVSQTSLSYDYFLWRL